MARTDGQSLGPGRIKVLSGLLGRCTVTRLPNFLGWVDLLSYGAPHSRAWSSAIMVSQNLEYCSRKVTHFLKYPTTVISFHGQIVPSQITLINSQIAPQNSLFVPQKKSVRSTYSYFKKGCRKKCTRQSRKVLWVGFSSLFFK